jgi:hypothetical protein
MFVRDSYPRSVGVVGTLAKATALSMAFFQFRLTDGVRRGIPFALSEAIDFSQSQYCETIASHIR